MDHRPSRKYCYAAISHPSNKETIALHNVSILKLAVLVSEFAQQLAAAHEFFSKEVQTIVSTFRMKSFDLQKIRPVDSPSTAFQTWEALLAETEHDAQAHLDAAGLLIKNVYHPLRGVASHKTRQTDMLASFRENLEAMVQQVAKEFSKVEVEYHKAYQNFARMNDPTGDEGEKVRSVLHQCHNDYIFNIRASNRLVKGYKKAFPEILEEMEEIYIDTSNTINVAIESHALLLLTKADEQHRRYEDQMKTCKQVNPYHDITVFVKTTALNSDATSLTLQFPRYIFKPALALAADDQRSLCTQLIRDRLTDKSIDNKKSFLQKHGMDLAVGIQHTQDLSNTLANVCQRNLASHNYAQVYETQLELCRKRNEIRIANLQLSAIKAQIELLTPRENGYVEEADGGEAEEEKGKRNASIKGMWKKAFKSLKSNDKQNWLSKKGSLIRRKDSEEKEEHGESSKEIDPVYSLLKCAADLPKVPAKSQKDSQGSGGAHHGGRGDSSGSTSKASSPSSSGIGPQFPSSPSHSSLPGSYSGGNGGSGGGGGGYGDGNSRNNAGGGGSGGGGSGSGGSGGTSSTLGNGAVFTSKSSRDREHMHHIVDESLGSEFRTFYKLTSPVKKTFIPSFESSSAKKSSPAPNFEGVVKRQTSYDAA